MNPLNRQTVSRFCSQFGRNAVAASSLLFVLFFSPLVSLAGPFQEMHGKADLVLVKKSERRLYLLKNGKAYRDFRIALGKNPLGSKQRAGDNRTPEGDYVLDWRNDDSRFYKSIHISYPNENDLASAKLMGADPGGMIMIHGVPNSPDYPAWLFDRIDWTDGCVAVTNEAMDEIWASVEEGTPIEIMP
jgi:murein L,D-transpeptidase YafK